VPGCAKSPIPHLHPPSGPYKKQLSASKAHPRVCLHIFCMSHYKFRGGLIYQIFELIGPPRPNKGNPTPCPHILILLTPQGGRGRRPRPPCSVHCNRIYGHGVGLTLFGFGGPISSKIRKISPPRNLIICKNDTICSQNHGFELKLGPNRSMSVQITPKLHSRGLGTDPGTTK